mgnify:CR=1 FL=1
MISAKRTLREAMAHAAEMGRKSSPPDSYYWSAVWWRLHSKESKNPSEPLGYSRSQMSLYRDMRSRPKHYADRLRPQGVSDWQWSGMKAND